jgi:hypothetical protein
MGISREIGVGHHDDMVLGAAPRLHTLPMAGSLHVHLARHRRRADKGDGLDLGRRQERLHRLSGSEPRSLLRLGGPIASRGRTRLDHHAG